MPPSGPGTALGLRAPSDTSHLRAARPRCARYPAARKKLQLVRADGVFAVVLNRHEHGQHAEAPRVQLAERFLRLLIGQERRGSDGNLLARLAMRVFGDRPGLESSFVIGGTDYGNAPNQQECAFQTGSVPGGRVAEGADMCLVSFDAGTSLAGQGEDLRLKRRSDEKSRFRAKSVDLGPH
jgi:hypothetical protein